MSCALYGHGPRQVLERVVELAGGCVGAGQCPAVTLEEEEQELHLLWLGCIYTVHSERKKGYSGSLWPRGRSMLARL
jgi:hypothetical protein